MKKKEFILILLNIRSAYNVGAIFRTADAAGVSKIYLCGYTPAPRDRFGRDRSDIAKAALGAEKTVPYEIRENAQEVLVELKKRKVYLIALEQAQNSIDYKKADLPLKTALIVGNETEGLPQEILSAVDLIVEIPMHGEKESLNVSVATGVALFRLIDR